MGVWLLLPVLGVPELREVTQPDKQGSDSFLWGARLESRKFTSQRAVHFLGLERLEELRWQWLLVAGSSRSGVQSGFQRAF